MRLALPFAALLSAVPYAVHANDWSYAASIYGWVPGLSGSIATQHGDLDFDVSGSDLISNLDIAFMGAFEARNGPWSLIGDLVYSDISATKQTPFGVLFADADVGLKLFILSGYGAYRVVESPDMSVDLAAGLRAYDMKISTTLNAGILPTESFAAEGSWVDPVVGARMNWQLADKWSATGFADVGGFGIGSDLSWQGLVTLDYQFNDKWSARLGYRYLEIDKPIQGRDAKIGLGGPIFGVTVRF